MTDQPILFGFGPVPSKCLGCAFISPAYDYHGKKLPQSCGATYSERVLKGCNEIVEHKSQEPETHQKKKDIHDGLEMDGILGSDWFDK